MNLRSLLVLVALGGAAMLGMYITEPDLPAAEQAESEAATPVADAAPVDPRVAAAERAAPADATGDGPGTASDRTVEERPLEPIDTATTAPADPAPERPAQTCGLVARDDAVGAVVFRAGPESLVVTAADLITSAPLAIGTEEWGVSIELCPEASSEMAHFTERRIGQTLQIIASGTLISAPVLRTAIRDGRLTLTGGFDRVRAQEIADRIAGRQG